MNTYTQIRDEAGMSLRDVETAMRPMFPSVSIAVLSAVEHPTLSGVTFTKSGESEFYRQTGHQTRRIEHRRLPVRLYLRCDEKTQERVKRARDLLALSTMQDTLSLLVAVALNGIEKAASAAGTVEAATDRKELDKLLYAYVYPTTGSERCQ